MARSSSRKPVKKKVAGDKLKTSPQLRQQNMPSPTSTSDDSDDEIEKVSLRPPTSGHTFSSLLLLLLTPPSLPSTLAVLFPRSVLQRRRNPQKACQIRLFVSNHQKQKALLTYLIVCY